MGENWGGGLGFVRVMLVIHRSSTARSRVEDTSVYSVHTECVVMDLTQIDTVLLCNL